MSTKKIILIVIGVGLIIAGIFIGRTEFKNITQTQTKESSIADVIQNVWISDEDSNFIRTIQKDGTLTDTYATDPSATLSGTWEILDEINYESIGIPATDNKSSYLRVVFSEEVFYYTIADITSTTLVLINLPRGNILNFTAAGE